MKYVINYSMKNKFDTREGYLKAAIEELRPMLKDAGFTIPDLHISIGWPSNRGKSNASETLGECWHGDASEDKHPHVFISPRMKDPLHFDKGDAMGVLPCLVHELVHSVMPLMTKHGFLFRKLATELGLEGKMTSTHAGEILAEKLAAISANLGPFPHSKLNRLSLGGPSKKQTTRMLKCTCPKCGYLARVTRVWLDIGAPICPTHKIVMDYETEE